MTNTNNESSLLNPFFLNDTLRTFNMTTYDVDAFVALTVAAAINDEMPSEKIIEHIKSCWQILRKISKNRFSNYQNFNSNEVSSKMILGTSFSFMDSLYIDLFKKLYSQSHPKMQRRFKKY
jgi:hypothetical protein